MLSNSTYNCLCVQSLSCVRLLQPPGLQPTRPLLSMGSSRQEYWSGLPFPPPGDLPHPGMDQESLASSALAREFFTFVGAGNFSTLFFFFSTFWPCHTACGILASPARSTEPRPPRVKVRSFNLWTAREVPPLGNFSDWFPLPSPAVFSATTLVSPQAVEEEALVYFHVLNPVDLPRAGSLRLYLPLW